MRVFVLGTGRCGTSTFSKACTHITNYSCGHESLSNRFGKERFAYPNSHIECDNRLSWHLGHLEELFGDDAYYVHLKRERSAVVHSLNARFFRPHSIIDAFCTGLRMNPPEKMTEAERWQACQDYIDTVYKSIDYFLANKSRKMELYIEKAAESLPVFWEMIGAEGNLDESLRELNRRYNETNWSFLEQVNPIYDLKLTASRLWKRTASAIRAS